MTRRDPQGQTAVALLSGGLDSGVAASMWQTAGGVLRLALTVDYGQRAAAREREVARAFAERLGVEWRAIDLPWLGAVASTYGSALTASEQPLPVDGSLEHPGDDRSAAAVWVPARNVVLLAVAAAHAEALGVEVVLAGFNREEAATFADNSPEFLADFGAVLARGTRSGVTAESPTLGLDKPGIVAEARRAGFGPADFWSCYEGGPTPCGRCESCKRSERAWSGHVYRRGG